VDKALEETGSVWRLTAMKLITASILLLIGIAIFTVPCRHNTETSPYRWVRALEPGDKSWPRWVRPIVGNDQKLRMIAQEQTWWSSDGISWNGVKNTAAKAVRPGAAQIFFKDKFWLLGGMNNWAEFTNEVWSSTDSYVWTMVSKQAPWPARRNALVVEFDDKLWLFGGAESSGQHDVTPTRFFRDVWQSTDGVEWRQISSNMPASDEQVLVFQNRIWLLGKDGVWNSNDGTTWRQTATGKPFSDRGSYGAVVYDGKMWIFGGMGAEKTNNEVWSSEDGIAWEENRAAPWFPRGGEYSAVFDGKLWIYGGKTGTTYDQADDVWFMTR
jgi:hypothetical protein